MIIDALLRAKTDVKNARELKVVERVAPPILSGKFGTSPCGTGAILKPEETIMQYGPGEGGDAYVLVAGLDARQYGCSLRTDWGRRFASRLVMLPNRRVHVFLFAALSAGARVIVARAFDHEELAPLLRATRPTVLSIVPTALLHLIRQHDISKDDLSSLRICRAGGDKVPAELEKEFTALTGIR